MLPQVVYREPSHFRIPSELPRQSLEVPGHRAGEQQQDVQTAPCAFLHRRVGNAATHQTDSKMPTAHGQMAQLVLRLARKHDIVYQDENVTGNPPALQIFLLLEQVAHQGDVHSLKKKRGSYQSSSCIFKVGLHDALPTKHTTRSNDVCNRLSRSLTAVDLPCRLPPQRAKLNGIRSRSRSGFQDGNILFP